MFLNPTILYCNSIEQYILFQYCSNDKNGISYVGICRCTHRPAFTIYESGNFDFSRFYSREQRAKWLLAAGSMVVIVASVYEIYRINKNYFLYAVEGVIAQCFKGSEMKCKIDLKDRVSTYQEENMNIHNNSGNIVKGDGNTVTATNTGNISEQVQVSGWSD